MQVKIFIIISEMIKNFGIEQKISILHKISFLDHLPTFHPWLAQHFKILLALLFGKLSKGNVSQNPYHWTFSEAHQAFLWEYSFVPSCTLSDYCNFRCSLLLG